ncbi:unnamed protein product [Acanthoscelides obtectus]|nr:unnamed protein product [Acanthoscelides obtectus]CAK1662166.1 hypothetical protein AOBTE_LOCUS23020 [Acanthoscelides obtectus]
MLATKMTSALERRDILDTLILGIEVGEDVPGLPTWLQKCMKMWERTLKFVQPVFYGVFPKTKPPGAKAMKLPFKLPLVHINVGTIYKIVKHCINVILYPPLLVSDIRNSPKELVKAGKYIMRGEKKLMKVIPKSLPKILHWLEDFPKKLSNGTIKVPFFLRHILQHGQSKKSLKSKRSKKRYNLNFDYMNMLGKVLQHPHMGDEPPEKRNKQLKKIVKSSET